MNDTYICKCEFCESVTPCTFISFDENTQVRCSDCGTERFVAGWVK